MNYWNDIFNDEIYNIKYENLVNDTKVIDLWPVSARGFSF